MRLPLKANDRAEVVDAKGDRVADFYSPHFPPQECQANAEQYAAFMNQRWENAA